MNDKNKTIFCFWEPKEKIPAYLKLCMKTWQKYLPDYEIKLLDYEDTKKLLGKNYYSKNFYNIDIKITFNPYVIRHFNVVRLIIF